MKQREKSNDWQLLLTIWASAGLVSHTKLAITKLSNLKEQMSSAVKHKHAYADSLDNNMLQCFFIVAELARELDLGEKINLIRVENPNSLQDQSHTLLKLWAEKEGNQATGQYKLDFDKVSTVNNLKL